MSRASKAALAPQPAERLLGSQYWCGDSSRHDDFAARVARAINTPDRVARGAGSTGRMHAAFGQRYYDGGGGVRYYRPWWGGLRLNSVRRPTGHEELLMPQWLDDGRIRLGLSIPVYHGEIEGKATRVDRVEADVTAGAQLVRWANGIWWLHLVGGAGARCYVGRAIQGGVAWQDAAHIFALLDPIHVGAGVSIHAIGGDE
ncbi:MAG: hypothetical protein ABS87_07935 [Sphingomonas sp. SCN 67-18]|uniref:hypothetical protein n=1 Tax=uncultured Sphingomonas sp. TaxID=158754 RepID=UPI00086ADFCB|nr:hypothetical protein [Sphingomonas sp. SCN 67-18]ODU21116.1 MAG: hypothetical protein ABS87_07935 [Sphingomonas sp. SCN 67-18]